MYNTNKWIIIVKLSLLLTKIFIISFPKNTRGSFWWEVLRSELSLCWLYRALVRPLLHQATTLWGASPGFPVLSKFGSAQVWTALSTCSPNWFFSFAGGNFDESVNYKTSLKFAKPQALRARPQQMWWLMSILCQCHFLGFSHHRCWQYCLPGRKKVYGDLKHTQKSRVMLRCTYLIYPM